MAEKHVISHNFCIKFNDQQKDRIAAALQALVDDMPGSPRQQALSPALSDNYELLSVEDLDIGEGDLKNVEKHKPMVDNRDLVKKYLKTLEENDKIEDEKVKHKSEVELLAENSYKDEADAHVWRCAPEKIMQEAQSCSNRSAGYIPFQISGSSNDVITKLITTHDMNEAVDLSNEDMVQGAAEVIEALEPEVNINGNISAGFFTIQIAGATSKFEQEDEPIFEKAEVELKPIELPKLDFSLENSNNLYTCIDSSHEDDSDKPQTRYRFNLLPHEFDKFTIFYCPVCGFDCGGPAEWSRHTETEHNFGLFEITNMQTVLATNGSKSNYQCGDCKNIFSLTNSYHNIMTHRITHLPYSRYIGCRICKLRYKNKQALYKHFRRDHPETVVPQQDYESLQHIRIFCHICKEQQSNEDEWRLHIAQKHDYNTKMKSKYKNAGYNAFICGICDERVSLSFIISHMLVHEDIKSFACTFCKEFESSQLEPALKHVRSKHLRKPREQIIKCSYCNIIFGSFSKRRKHYVTVHNFKLQKCYVCNHHFDGIAGLKKHMKSHNVKQ